MHRNRQHGYHLLPAPGLPGLAIILLLSIQVLTATAQPKKNQDKHMNLLHTARVLENHAGDYTEVVFLESARFYRLLKTNPHYDQYLRLLKKAEEDKAPVGILLTTAHGDIIEKVERKPGKKKKD